MTPLLLGLLLYVLAQLVLGALASRGIRSEADYLVAGRRLGPTMATASIFATWFGAETCVGAASEVYAHGFSRVLTDPFGYALCLLLFGLFFASPLYRQGITTLADWFRARFSAGVERLVAVLLIPGSLLWAAAQMRAFGQVLAEGTGLSVGSAIAIAAGASVAYTAFGGLLADAYTDLIQGAVLIGCLLVLGVLVVMDSGGPVQALNMLQQARQVGEADGSSWLEALDRWAVPVLGSLFAQELASRVVASRSATLAKRATLVAAGVYLCLGLIPVCLGAIARTTLPGQNPEAVLAALSQRHLGSVGYVVFAGALVSAILSTVDSALLVSGSLVSHNLAPVFRPDLDERARLRLARLSVCGLGLVAYLLAYDGESVHDLVMEASAFGSAGICISGTLGLFTRVGGTRSAYGALGAGALAWILAAYVFSSRAAFISSLAAALLGYAAGAFQRHPEAEAYLGRRP